MTRENESLQVALVQAELKWRDPAANRDHLQQLIGSCAQDSDVCVLPETFTTGFLGDQPSSEEGMDGATVEWMSRWAGEFNTVITGSAVIISAQGRRNRLLWVEPDGRVRFYDKRHLFAFGGENERYVAGRERVVWSYRGWRFCPQICYDIRFPVWCRNQDDYDVMLVVANWPTPRVDAWSSLLKARAIENQCYLLAVNRVGEDGKGIQYPGNSVAHDGFGAELLKLGDSERTENICLSGAALDDWRGRFPFQEDADTFTIDY